MAKLRKYLSGYRPAALSAPAQGLTVRLGSVLGSDYQGSATPADVGYVEWLAKARGITLCEAYDYAMAQPRGRIVSQSVDFLDVRPEKLKPGKKWKANYTWYRPPVFRPAPMTAKELSRQRAAYSAFERGDNADFRRAA
jgi:hypothetical protein